MSPSTRTARLALIVFLLVLDTRPGQAQSTKSLPLDPRVYEQIIAARGRVPESQRLEQLIAQYRGELQVERVDNARMEGHRVARVSQSANKLALWQTIADVRLETVRSVDPSKLDEFPVVLQRTWTRGC